MRQRYPIFALSGAAACMVSYLLCLASPAAALQVPQRPFSVISAISGASTSSFINGHARSGISSRRPYMHSSSRITPLGMSSSSQQEPPAPPEFDLPNPLSFLAKSSPSDRSADLMIGEEAAAFDWSNEKMERLGDNGWLSFFAAVGAILTAVAVIWVYPPTGYADDFQHLLESAAGGNSHLVTLSYGIIFPIVHSGLASLRPYGEKVIGARAWRVVFAFPSLCLAYSWITYFIAHVHDGYQFYDISGIPWVHTVAWIINFASFLFLYPSVFNLKEVAAIDKPQVHLWETGVIRITRHPQFVGQAMWSLAHLAMVGTTFSLLTQALLVGHHAFACWNGDRRLLAEHGDNFLKIKERTSIVPFQAIVEGRQKLPPDYYKELLRAPYALIAVGSIGAYLAHPYMQAGAALVKNTGLVEGGILDGLIG